MGLGKRQGIALAMGLTLFFAGWSLKQSNPGLDIGFFPSFTNSTTGELMFWLVVTLMLTPAGALLGYAFAPRLEAPLTALWQRIEQMDLKEKRVGLALVFIVGFSLARATHLLVLQEFPFTDDEWAARFGGQILATGHATMPLPHGYRAMPDLYLFVRSGTVTSFDWLGAQATWAFSFLTGTGAAIFHFFAALGALGVTVVIGKRLSSAWALVAAGLFLFSPMGFLLSASTHTHLQSRGLIAVVLGLLLIAEESKRFGWWAAVGLCTGLSVASRPLETAFSLAPMFLDLIWRARSDRDLRRAIPPFLLGLAVPMVFFCLHMQAVTGSPFLPARFAKNEIVPFGGARTRPPLASFTSLTVFWQRFGQNCSYNFFSLIIFAGGALGAAFAFLGVFRDRYTKLLGWCVVSSLALALVHDNPGIHSAGPMHYSEALVLLVLVAFAIIGFTYRVQCLMISVEGSSVTALRSKARMELETAQRAIEEAKRSYETKIMKRLSRY